MSTGWSIFVASFIASLGVVAASASLLLVGQQFCRNLIPRLVSFAVGTLLAGAFLAAISHGGYSMDKVGRRNN
jgi:ABC-type Fe3+-siderophore transport system permease subunit